METYTDMNDRFSFRVPQYTDKEHFIDFDYIDLGEIISCTLAGITGKPQQCTGYKDVNGKLIYEGDILRSNKSNIAEDNDIFEVYYDDDYAQFLLCKVGQNAYCMDLMDTDNPEIIGNICKPPKEYLKLQK